MRPPGTAQQLERRRHQAIVLLKAGRSFRVVAQRLRASLSSVVRWYQAYRKNKHAGLRGRPHPGRSPRLSRPQKAKLQRLLIQGSVAAGYSTELWTLKRMAEQIQKHFGVGYTQVGVWKLMRQQLRWSCQKPEKRALERNEEAIAHWIRYKLPHIKKSRKTWGPSRLPR